jgi:hypothetical protein
MDATPELAQQAISKLKRLWKARNEPSSSFSQRRAMLRREGIITLSHCDGASSDDGQEDGDSKDDNSELSVSTESVGVLNGERGRCLSFVRNAL